MVMLVRGRFQNPLAQYDVRAGEPSRHWEGRWYKWEGQADVSDIAVEDFLVVVVFGLHHLVADTISVPKPLNENFVCGRVQSLLQIDIQ